MEPVGDPWTDGWWSSAAWLRYQGARQRRRAIPRWPRPPACSAVRYLAFVAITWLSEAAGQFGSAAAPWTVGALARRSALPSTGSAIFSSRQSWRASLIGSRKTRGGKRLRSQFRPRWCLPSAAAFSIHDPVAPRDDDSQPVVGAGWDWFQRIFRSCRRRGKRRCADRPAPGGARVAGVLLGSFCRLPAISSARSAGRNRLASLRRPASMDGGNSPRRPSPYSCDARSAWSRSAMMSRTSSMPIERRTNSGVTPVCACSSGVSCEWVVVAG